MVRARQACVMVASGAERSIVAECPASRQAEQQHCQESHRSQVRGAVGSAPAKWCNRSYCGRLCPVTWV